MLWLLYCYYYHWLVELSGCCRCCSHYYFWSYYSSSSSNGTTTIVIVYQYRSRLLQISLLSISSELVAVAFLVMGVTAVKFCRIRTAMLFSIIVVTIDLARSGRHLYRHLILSLP